MPDKNNTSIKVHLRARNNSDGQLHSILGSLIQVIEGNDFETRLPDHAARNGQTIQMNLYNKETYSLASGSFVPLSRTMRGTLRDNSFAALITPSAM